MEGSRLVVDKVERGGIEVRVDVGSYRRVRSMVFDALDTCRERFDSAIHRSDASVNGIHPLVNHIDRGAEARILVLEGLQPGQYLMENGRIAIGVHWPHSIGLRHLEADLRAGAELSGAM